jgi:cell division protein FtsI/penicillin-binding protein 2
LVVPLAIVCVLAFIAGMAVAGGSDERDSVARFGDAWAAGDIDAMYAELNPSSQAQYSAGDLRAAYEREATTATATAVAVGDTRGPIDQDGTEVVALPTTIQTTAFGEVSGEIAVPVADGGISWQPNLVFPGLGEGEKLISETKVPKRAPILAADRTPLAQGPAGARTTSGSGGIVTGETATPPPERQQEMKAAGFPKGTPAGTSGLELAFDEILSGTPGGKLFASGEDGRTLIARRAPIPGKPVRTTIDADLQDATAAALGSTFGGAAVLNAENGNVLALAGQAFSALQPPGSTFKVITATAALENGETKLSEQFPVETGAVVDGRTVSNAYDESCGGTLLESFAHSCNSVFAPLGVRVGGDALVKTAELFGFNSPPTLYNPQALALTDPPVSSIPKSFESDLDLAVSSIGQGQVQATPLAMASASQAIAEGGVRSPTAIVKDPELSGDYPTVKVMSPKVADEMKQMMIAVVNSGTGAAASLPGVQVAGKTGTAELGTSSSGETTDDGDAELDVDAWFTAFAPADKPKLAVAVEVFNAPGDGGTVAAPIAAQILSAGL